MSLPKVLHGSGIVLVANLGNKTARPAICIAYPPTEELMSTRDDIKKSANPLTLIDTPIERA